MPAAFLFPLSALTRTMCAVHECSSAGIPARKDARTKKALGKLQTGMSLIRSRVGDRLSLSSLRCLLAVLLASAGSVPLQAQSDPVHRADHLEIPAPWPDGIIPYDISRLTAPQQQTVRRAMQRWMDTGARIVFVPRATRSEYVSFTGRTDAGNNTSQTGFKAGAHAEINITAFWWEQGEWMPAHELGHVLGFHHEHQRWDRDAYVTIHYEHIKPGRSGDYDWIAKTNWLVSSMPYDYFSIMHYRVCWASSCEPQCKDGNGRSPCAVIEPVSANFDGVIGQWDHNGISAGDAEKLRRAYGMGRTIYVQSEHSSEGSGTLEEPYGELARARQNCPQQGRIIVLSGSGSWSLAPSTQQSTDK